MEIPPSTFDLWRRRARSLHERGYLLLPHRREWRRADAESWQLLTDCHAPWCRGRTEVLVDAAGPPFVFHAAGPCGGAGFSAASLRSLAPRRVWRVHELGLAAEVPSTGNVEACHAVCAEVPGCRYFSVGRSRRSNACLVHRRCAQPRRPRGLCCWGPMGLRLCCKYIGIGHTGARGLYTAVRCALRPGKRSNTFGIAGVPPGAENGGVPPWVWRAEAPQG